MALFFVDILKQWHGRAYLGGCRYTYKIECKDPSDPPVLRSLTPKAKEQLIKRFPELWGSWEQLKAMNKKQNEEIKELYQQFNEKVKTIRHSILLPEVEEADPSQICYIPSNLSEQMYDEAYARREGTVPSAFKIIPEGNLFSLQRNQIVARGGRQELESIKDKIDRFTELQDTKNLINKIIKTITDGETKKQMAIADFETKRDQAIHEIEWEYLFREKPPDIQRISSY
jgi:hypothetical protein